MSDEESKPAVMISPVVIESDKKQITVGDFVIKIKDKRFWKYFGIGMAIGGIILGLYTTYIGA